METCWSIQIEQCLFGVTLRRWPWLRCRRGRGPWWETIRTFLCTNKPVLSLSLNSKRKWRICLCHLMEQSKFPFVVISMPVFVPTTHISLLPVKSILPNPVRYICFLLCVDSPVLLLLFYFILYICTLLHQGYSLFQANMVPRLIPLTVMVTFSFWMHLCWRNLGFQVVPFYPPWPEMLLFVTMFCMKRCVEK